MNIAISRKDLMGLLTKRIGKGQRKAGRGNRWGGPQGPSRRRVNP